MDTALDISHPEAEAALQALRDALHQSGEMPTGEEADGEEHDRLVEVLRAAGQASSSGLDGGLMEGLVSAAMPQAVGRADSRGTKRQRVESAAASQSGQNAELQDTVQTLMTEFMDPCESPGLARP